MDRLRGATVFLTGATGFIGGRLAAALSARGCRLRCLVRRPERAGELARLGAELLVGDVNDVALMQRGLRDATIAYHVAGAYDLGIVDASVMERTNVQGTRTFIDALRATPVPRALYVSTTLALGPAAVDGKPTSSHNGPFTSVYARTKTEAHTLAVAAQQEGLPLIIMCPANVYGPGDVGPNGRFVIDLLRHRIPGLSTAKTWFSYVHVDDVVTGLIAAAAKGRIGETYVLSGEDATVDAFAQRVVQLAGTWVSPLRFPPFAVRWTGMLMDAFTRATGVRMPISRELADTAGTGLRWVHSHAQTTAELGYSPRSLAEGLPETVREARARLSR